MGGWVAPPGKGLPAWGPECDFNVQWDAGAAAIVAATADLTLATLPATIRAHLRAADAPRLRASGPLGLLLAEQSEVHARAEGMSELGRAHAALPDDLLNFHYDPVACAVAVGWPGATVAPRPLRTVLEDGVLRFWHDRRDRLIRVLVDVDGAASGEAWLLAVEGVQR